MEYTRHLVAGYLLGFLIWFFVWKCSIRVPKLQSIRIIFHFFSIPIQLAHHQCSEFKVMTIPKFVNRQATGVFHIVSDAVGRIVGYMV